MWLLRASPTAVRRSLEPEFAEVGLHLPAIRQPLALAVVVDVRRHLHHHLQGVRLALRDAGAVLDRADASRGRRSLRAHHAAEAGIGAMKLEKDRIIRRLQAAVGLALEEFAADDLAVVAEAVGEAGVAGIE